MNAFVYETFEKGDIVMFKGAIEIPEVNHGEFGDGDDNDGNLSFQWIKESNLVEGMQYAVRHVEMLGDPGQMGLRLYELNSSELAGGGMQLNSAYFTKDKAFINKVKIVAQMKKEIK